MRFFIFLSLILCSTLVHGQTFLPAKNVAELKLKIATAAANNHSIKADFSQEKTMRLLTDKLISKGVFYFQDPKQVRLEYKTPSPYIMVINQGKVWIKNDQKTKQTDLNKNKMAQQLSAIIMDCVQGKMVNSKDFDISFFENSTQIKLEMQPLGKGLKLFFKSINLVLEKKDFTAARIEMIENKGDSTVLIFTNKIVNSSFPASLFLVN